MILQILPPEGIIASENVIDTQLLLVILSLAFATFLIIKAAKLLNNIKVPKRSKKQVILVKN
tara:strand:+ start:1883 stop:2068 length:186 start_codon:yes stop_codon:yes gene_type:complete